ncbi:MAG: purine/pyrimidine permease [Deltaproteobacteria bacterium]|nr:purine/pyrimidine permease [Deltaproteobacteria bacterium]MBW2634723.1 purine/pyrimidine permease [Deltaproteobacteria bacterium]
MSEEQAEHKHWIVYPLGSKPKWGLAILLGIQQYLTMFGATVLIPFIVGGAMGLPPDQLALMISTIFFTSGLCTLIQQSPLGNKLPVIQGGTFSFLGPTFAILGLCTAELATEAGVPLWQLKIQMVSGAIMVASVVEIVLGYTGIMGQVRKIISPIVIGPTIAMIGLALFNIGAPWMAGNWIISLITLIALILYSQVFSHKSKVFMLFPVLLAIATGWLCALLGTVTGLIPDGNAANLGGKLDLIGSAAWLSFKPMMPFKWGFPNFGSSVLWAGVFGMLAGYLASMIESIGDYYACARISEAPVPTGKMISRGLGAEGLGCLIAGILQTGNGTTTYSENIGSIGLTKVASRRVVRCGAAVMLFIPIIGKFGAVLATLPQPVVGAMFVGLFGMIASVGLSNLQIVNLNNSRNLFIIGISFFAGLSVPYHFNPMLSASAVPIDWSAGGPFFAVLGNISQAILTTGMAVTALLGIVLDNFLPGASRAERGLEVWENEASDEAWEEAEAKWAAMKEGEMRPV